jgi:putative ABC transport system substrate-binding protein
VLALFAAPLAVGAQPAGKIFKVGLLATLRPTGNPPAGPGSGESMVVALKELGYIEGRNIVIERRYSEGVGSRLPGLAAELVGLKPDVIFAYGGVPSAAVHRATETIPIVAVSGDLVAEGLVASLARPGGNVTGLQTLWTATAGKRMALLKEAIPGLSRVGVLFAARPGSQWQDDTKREIHAAGRALHLTIHFVQAADVGALDTTFATLVRERVQAMVIPGTQISTAQRGHLTELARRYRMPTMGDDRAYSVQAGFLMSYGFDPYAPFGRRPPTSTRS